MAKTIPPASQWPDLGFGAPTLGKPGNPVNAQFAGPNGDGMLNDVPPQFGLGHAPLVAINGVKAPKLGTGTVESPKTHG